MPLRVPGMVHAGILNVCGAKNSTWLFKMLSTIFAPFFWREEGRNTIIILCFREQSDSVFVCLYRMQCDALALCPDAPGCMKWTRMEESRNG